MIRTKMRVIIAFFVCIQVYFACCQDCPAGICSSDETCCPGPIPGLYGCCPLVGAVCCSDGEHCCPANTVCNLAQSTCDNSTGTFPFMARKKPGVKISSVAMKSDVVFCGGSSYCQDGSTCCILPNGQYGCCPYPSALCCNDRVHCCPYGTRCDTTSQYCLQGDSLLRVAPKRPKKPAMQIIV